MIKALTNNLCIRICPLFVAKDWSRQNYEKLPPPFKKVEFIQMENNHYGLSKTRIRIKVTKIIDKMLR